MTDTEYNYSNHSYSNRHSQTELNQENNQHWTTSENLHNYYQHPHIQPHDSHNKKILKYAQQNYKQKIIDHQNKYANLYQKEKITTLGNITITTKRCPQCDWTYLTDYYSGYYNLCVKCLHTNIIIKQHENMLRRRQVPPLLYTNYRVQ